MKKLFAAALVALTVSTASVSFATTKNIDKGHAEQAVPASAAISQISMSKLDVVIEKDANPKTIIRLTDSSGKILSIKTVFNTNTGTRIRFDLAQLVDGVYFVKVWNGHSSQIQKFELKTAALSLTAYGKLAIIQKPNLVQNLSII